MGRTLKRVPLTFDWPMGKIWKGYLCPDGNKDYDEWWENERQDPPRGDGWQLWETTTEGSPISPVFTNCENLARYAEKHCTVWGDQKATYREWGDTLYYWQARDIDLTIATDCERRGVKPFLECYEMGGEYSVYLNGNSPDGYRQIYRGRSARQCYRAMKEQQEKYNQENK